MTSISLSSPISQQKVDEPLNSSATPGSFPLHATPEALSLVNRIEEKALRFTLRHQKTRKKSPTPSLIYPPSSGNDRVSGALKADPLVSNAISRRTPTPAPLPPWCSVPTAPATWYQVFHRDVYVCRSFPAPPPPDVPRGKKAEIFEFSDKSRANLRHVCNNSGHLVKSQFGLTYHEQWPEDGREVKRHLHAWLKSLNRLCPGVGNLWVLEFQERGAPHYHVFLTISPDRKIQLKLADAWMRITRGTDAQAQFHAHPKNWKKWAMNDPSYVMKYAEKKDQKQVPEQFHNVGRFWGHSRNMQPVGMIVEPSAVCRFVAPGVAQWDEDSLTRFINRTLRRFHEKRMNYDRKTGERRKQKRKKSPIVRGQSEIPGSFCIPFGAPLINQIMNYVAENGPDPGTFARIQREKVPF